MKEKRVRKDEYRCRIGASDEIKKKRMVICWKCANGFLIAGKMFCNKTNTVVEDFMNPPDGCPIKTRWQEDDANEQRT